MDRRERTCLGTLLLSASLVAQATLMFVGGAAAEHAPEPPRWPWADAESDGILVSWHPPDGVDNSTLQGYRVYLVENETRTPIANTTPNETSYWDGPLAPNLTRTYHVTTVALDGHESAPSSNVTATSVEPPGAPAWLHAAGGVDVIDLSWGDASGNITGWEIFRGTEPGGPKSFRASIWNASRRSYTDEFVQPHVTYYYQVRAANFEVSGPFSEEASNASITLPAAPQSLAAEGSYRQVNLTWQHPPDNGGSPVVGYELYRGPTDDNVSRYQSLGNVTRYEDAAAGDDATWCYRVSAVTYAGEGPQSDAVCASTWGVPSPPHGLTATRNGTGVELAWQPPWATNGTLLEYRVYRGNASGELNLIRIVGPGVTSYVDEAPPRGITLYYHVTAVNAIGESAVSNEATALVPAPPSEPQNFTATKTLGAIRLAWDPPASDGGAPLLTYRVYRAVGSGSLSLLHEQPATDEDYDDATCPLLTICTYRVAATNEAGEGALSPSRSAIG